MKGTHIQRGETLDYTNITNDRIEAGTLLFIGVLAAIAATTIEPEQTGTVVTNEVWDFAKGTDAIDAGAKVYYDSSNDVLTTTGTNNSFVGVAVYAAAAADKTVAVRLNG